MQQQQQQRQRRTKSRTDFPILIARRKQRIPSLFTTCVVSLYRSSSYLTSCIIYTSLSSSGKR